MWLPVQDKNSKMERNKKTIVGLVLTSLLAFSVVPYFNVKAQTCNPDALVPVPMAKEDLLLEMLRLV
jgi:hypothetical protein